MKPGDVIASKYQLVSRIGQGGMGSVWRVTNTATGRDFAIKFLHAAVAQSDDSRSRFVQEARASARINHPNAIDIFDVGEADDSLYLVMELLDGISLGDALRSEPPFSARDLLIVLSEACTALHVAHRAGIVHRDLKPPNIFLHRDRASGFVMAKVLDFGVSKLMNADDGVSTNTGSLLGSPRYMSPEQAISASSTDGRSDIWSIGVVLFEGLTGRFPHDGDSSNNLIVAIATTPPKPVEAVAPHLPVALRMLINDCLQPVGQRIQSIGTLLDRMLSILSTHDLSDLPLARPTVGKGKPRARPDGMMFRTSAGMIPGLATSMLQAHGLGDLARYLKPGAQGGPPASPASDPRYSQPGYDAAQFRGTVRIDQAQSAPYPVAGYPQGGAPSYGPAQSPQYGAAGQPAMLNPTGPFAPVAGRSPSEGGSYVGSNPAAAAVRSTGPQAFGFAPPSGMYQLPGAQLGPSIGQAQPGVPSAAPAQDPMTESISSINVVRGAQQAFGSAPPANRATGASKKGLLVAVVGLGLFLTAGGLVAYKAFTTGAHAAASSPADTPTTSTATAEPRHEAAVTEPTPSVVVSPTPSVSVSAQVASAKPSAAPVAHPVAGPHAVPPPPPPHTQGTGDPRSGILDMKPF